MTYTIVMTILVLALIAVVIAVVFITDEDHESIADLTPRLESNQAMSLSASEAHVSEGNAAGDIGIVELSEETDRNAWSVGIRARSSGDLAE